MRAYYWRGWNNWGPENIGLWRVYPSSAEARIALIINGVGVREQAINVLEKSPFIVTGDHDTPVAKLIIGNLPLSLSNSEIEVALRKIGVKFRSQLREEHYRDEEGK
ncbi:hypothetical protein ElyMa_005401800 [Elysia marginata]|uniref:RRM domain-containing protein n=1 Tax=Elysia marginata TaxID=1093978 RepID=A0AAV4EHF6_9GAST|nr:hypothetical protein ElyMa_005401800 [Elysia marginata]